MQLDVFCEVPADRRDRPIPAVCDLPLVVLATRSPKSYSPG